ncbi:MAG TPA: NIPSNAP family containing protein, partial [Ktedonobacteraceae bacterium]|nr:NIPSNAP family containing protein [Ktedonobacteraceae bacterium]
KALQDFYSGPIWREHAAASNDTMIDVSNVLLLKPAHASSGLHLNRSDRPTREAQDQAGGIIIATIYSFEAPVDAKFVDFFANDMAPVLRDAGATLLGQFVTDASENTFPQLPVREGENVFVWLASFATDTAYATYHIALAKNQMWTTMLTPILHNHLIKPVETLELTPSRRSLLRHRTV